MYWTGACTCVLTQDGPKLKAQAMTPKVLRGTACVSAQARYLDNLTQSGQAQGLGFFHHLRDFGAGLQEKLHEGLKPAGISSGQAGLSFEMKVGGENYSDSVM